MSNPIGIGPNVMINRLADRTGVPADAKLLAVAKLRMALETAIQTEQAKAAQASPTGDARAPVVSSGADVDRLI